MKHERMIEFIASVKGIRIDEVEYIKDGMTDKEFEAWYNHCRTEAISMINESMVWS